MKISFHEKKLSYENEEDNQNIKNNKFKEGEDTDSSKNQDKFFSNSSKPNSNSNKKSKRQLFEESQKEILEDDSDIKEDQNKSKKKEKKIELLNLGKLINREYIIEDNIQKGNISDNFWYKKIKYVNKPYYLMTKTKLAAEKNILYYYCNNHATTRLSTDNK